MSVAEELWECDVTIRKSVVSVYDTLIVGIGYDAGAVAWAAEQGVTKGVSSTRFAPDDACTRAQIVTFLCRADGALKNEKGA